MAVVPATVTGELPADNVPPLIKSPWKVRAKLPVVRDDPELIFRGALLLLPSCRAPFRVMTPVFLIRTPPVAINVGIHSGPEVNAAGLLYWSVAPEP